MPTMPRAICVPCGLMYQVERNSVQAVSLIVPRENETPPVHYTALQSDRYKCEGCGHEILVGFGEHFQWVEGESNGPLPPAGEHGGRLEYYYNARERREALR